LVSPCFFSLDHRHPKLFKHFVEHFLRQALGWKEGKHPSLRIHTSTHASILNMVHCAETLSLGQRGQAGQAGQAGHSCASTTQLVEGSLQENINKTGTNRILFKTLL
jgi:hypothetical protein